jgi:1-acyl-sn-glycerol-3-phosphate acyltransferase
MGWVRWFSTRFLRLAAALLLRVETRGMERIPLQGPVILAINHVNFIDALLLYTLLPRKTVGLAKAEIWRLPILGLVARSWEAIPVRRGELDLDAFRRASRVLQDGGMLGLAPEGTRSHTGCLLRARPGAVMLALRAPGTWIIPMAIFGHEDYSWYWRRFRRTPVHLNFGQAFRLRPQADKASRCVRQQMADEIMLQIAALLPPQYHGAYADAGTTTPEYLEFDRDGGNNMHPTPSHSAAASAGKERGT